MEEPLYIHDCDECVFLGTFEGNDLYRCGMPVETVIARRSSSGPDYSSGIEFAVYGDDKALREALRITVLSQVPILRWKWDTAKRIINTMEPGEVPLWMLNEVRVANESDIHMV
jgi:hypothetical protein